MHGWPIENNEQKSFLINCVFLKLFQGPTICAFKKIENKFSMDPLNLIILYSKFPSLRSFQLQL